MKLIAITLAALFLTATAVPAEAATRSRVYVPSQASTPSTGHIVFVQQALIPGANGCCE